jgi:hypothetical protein
MLSLLIVAFASPALAGVTGGWGVTCSTGTVTCSYSGRVIGCQVNGPVLMSQRSQCILQTGSVGYVQCTLFDQFGRVIGNYLDKCP